MRSEHPEFSDLATEHDGLVEREAPAIFEARYRAKLLAALERGEAVAFERVRTEEGVSARPLSPEEIKRQFGTWDAARRLGPRWYFRRADLRKLWGATREEALAELEWQEARAAIAEAERQKALRAEELRKLRPYVTQDQYIRDYCEHVAALMLERGENPSNKKAMARVFCDMAQKEQGRTLKASSVERMLRAIAKEQKPPGCGAE